MIYTSYFAKLRKLPENIIPISVCAKPPEWYDGLQYKKLAPKYHFFMAYKEDSDEAKYTECFNNEVLNGLNPTDIANELYTLANGATDIVLLCFEKPPKFCHRHIVSRWFRDNGIDCNEIEI